jgi:hypothetical protein
MEILTQSPKVPAFDVNQKRHVEAGLISSVNMEARFAIGFVMANA